MHPVRLAVAVAAVAALSGCGGNLNPFNRGGSADEAEPQQGGRTDHDRAVRATTGPSPAGSISPSRSSASSPPAGLRMIVDRLP